MKLHRIFAFLCCLSMCGYAGAMDKKKDAYLKFKLDKELRIVDHKAKNMDFFIVPEHFLGEIITETIPLERQALADLNNGFQKAFIHKKKQKVEYMLEDRLFIAAIKNRSNNNGFSVKVREVNRVDNK